MLKLAKDANDVRGTCAAIAAETVLLPMEKRIEAINSGRQKNERKVKNSGL